MLKSKYDEIVKRHRPGGYGLEFKNLRALDGEARNEKTIVISNTLTQADMLFVFLHECGHVHMRHLVKDGKLVGTRWREEYEADQYAIAAMREAGVAVPRDMLAHRKSVVRELIEECKDGEVPDEKVLKYAYGKNWRQHR